MLRESQPTAPGSLDHWPYSVCLLLLRPRGAILQQVPPLRGVEPRETGSVFFREQLQAFQRRVLRLGGEPQLPKVRHTRVLRYS